MGDVLHHSVEGSKEEDFVLLQRGSDQNQTKRKVRKRTRQGEWKAREREEEEGEGEGDERSTW